MLASNPIVANLGSGMSKGPATSRKRISQPDRHHHEGETIPKTGLYRVRHAEHRLPQEVTLRKGETFPHCDACTGNVDFILLEAAPVGGDDKTFKVVLYSLPVVDDEDADTGHAIAI